MKKGTRVALGAYTDFKGVVVSDNADCTFTDFSGKVIFRNEESMLVRWDDDSVGRHFPVDLVSEDQLKEISKDLLPIAQ